MNGLSGAPSRVGHPDCKQALNTLAFLGKKVHGVGEFELEFKPAWKGHRRPPTVMTRDEVKKVIGFLEDPWKLIAQLLYGSGLRQSEGLSLRVKDIDFGQGTITIHDAEANLKIFFHKASYPAKIGFEV